MSHSCLYFLSNRESAISFSDRIKSGVVGEQLWLQITEPTEKDTGKYAIEFHDGKSGLRRTVELSGQGENISIFETSGDRILWLYHCLLSSQVAADADIRDL